MNMVENYVWGISWSLGNNKHPPLFGWITALWFKVFPTVDWAYYLLNEVSLLIALIFLMLSMRKMLGENKVYIALALTIVIFPIGITTGYKYNANLAQWPFITGYLWALLTALTDRQAPKYMLAGAFAGAALLCKYSAILLIGPITFVAWFYLRPKWVDILPMLFLMAAACLMLLVPHVYWEMQHGWPSLHYMHERHTASNSIPWASVVAIRLLDVLRFVSGAIVILAIALITRRKTIEASENTHHPRTQFGLMIFILSLLSVFAGSFVEHMNPVSDWFIVLTIFFGWALVDLLPAAIEWDSLKSRINILIILYFILAAILAVDYKYSDENARSTPTAIAKTLSQDVTSLYHSIYNKPIDYAAGTFPLAYDLSFYSADHPYAMYGLDTQASNWIDIDQLRLKNKVIICGGLNMRKYYSPAGPDCNAQAIRLFGLPDTQRTLQYPIYDPVQKKNMVAEYDILMYRQVN